MAAGRDPEAGARRPADPARVPASRRASRCSSPRAPRSAGRLARDPSLRRRRARRPGRLLRLRGARLRRPAPPTSTSRATPTARSTTRCSAPTTRTSSSAVLFNLWLLAKLARGFTTYRLNAVAGDRLVLARRQRPDDRRARRPSSRRAHEPAGRLEILQWVGLCSAARWSGPRSTSSATASPRPSAARAALRWGIQNDVWQGALMAAAAACVVAAELAAITVIVATRALELREPAARPAASRFFAIAAARRERDLPDDHPARRLRRDPQRRVPPGMKRALLISAARGARALPLRRRGRSGAAGRPPLRPLLHLVPRGRRQGLGGPSGRRRGRCATQDQDTGIGPSLHRRRRARGRLLPAHRLHAAPARRHAAAPPPRLF